MGSACSRHCGGWNAEAVAGTGPGQLFRSKAVAPMSAGALALAANDGVLAASKTTNKAFPGRREPAELELPEWPKFPQSNGLSNINMLESPSKSRVWRSESVAVSTPATAGNAYGYYATILQLQMIHLVCNLNMKRNCAVRRPRAT